MNTIRIVSANMVLMVLGEKTVPPPLACASDLQRWHRLRTQVGPFPDPNLMAARAKLREVQPQPTPFKLGPVPRGSPPIIPLSTSNGNIR
ncbi:hypothetical protein FQN60_012592 [Etheostoma spectabile]|uniref:Uncharacterized protein n=1 Tax=Etheostoma spectabile TaxID=54343 RepID=A0A5J5D591_9PERO|nr:hypothetical protein FQN60_012592 [Etheostoma spectabile]